MDMGGLWDFVRSLGGGRQQQRPMMEQQEEEEPNYNFDFETPRTDAYLEHLRQAPRSADSRPNFGRKLAAGLIGAVSGQGNAQAVLNAPYQNKLRDFNESGAGLKEGAEYEQKDLPNRRLSMQAMMSDSRSKRDYLQRVKQATQNYEAKMASVSRLRDKDAQDKAKSEAQNELSERVLQARQEHNRVMEGQGAARTKAYSTSVNDQHKRLTDAYSMDAPVKAGEQLQIEKVARHDVARDPRFTPFWNGSGFATQPVDANGKPLKGPDGKPLVMDETTQKLLADALDKAKNRAATRTRRSYTEPSDDLLAQYGFGVDEEEE